MHCDLGVDVPRPMVGKNNVSGNWMENETTEISSSVSDAGQFDKNWLLLLMGMLIFIASRV